MWSPSARTTEIYLTSSCGRSISHAIAEHALTPGAKLIRSSIPQRTRLSSSSINEATVCFQQKGQKAVSHLSAVVMLSIRRIASKACKRRGSENRLYDSLSEVRADLWLIFLRKPSTAADFRLQAVQSERKGVGFRRLQGRKAKAKQFVSVELLTSKQDDCPSRSSCRMSRSPCLSG